MLYYTVLLILFIVLLRGTHYYLEMKSLTISSMRRWSATLASFPC